MYFRKTGAVASLILISSFAMAESAQRTADLSKLYGIYEKSGYSSLELTKANNRVLISGIALEVGDSFTGNSILKVGARANSQELARLTAADEMNENKLRSFQTGAKINAVCDLGFTSGTQYLSFQECIFK
jgi:hypothetical protein